MGGGELWSSSRPFSPAFPLWKGKIYSGSLGKKKSSLQHLDTRDTKACLAVTVANLKVVKVLAGTWGRVMDSCISLADQGCEIIVEQKIRPEQAGGLTGPGYSPQL